MKKSELKAIISKILKEELNNYLICKIQKGINKTTGGIYYNVFPTRGTKFFDDWNKYAKTDRQDTMHFESIAAAKEMVQEFCEEFKYDYSKIYWEFV